MSDRHVKPVSEFQPVLNPEEFNNSELPNPAVESKDQLPDYSVPVALNKYLCDDTIATNLINDRVLESNFSLQVPVNGHPNVRNNEVMFFEKVDSERTISY